MAEKTNGAAAAAKAGGLTNTEAVRRALQELGKNAKPAEIRPFLKERFQLDLTPEQISNCKKDALGRKRGSGGAKAKAKAKTAAKAPAAPPMAPAAAKTKEAGLPLADILAVKKLVERFGPAPLHTLIDAFTR